MNMLGRTVQHCIEKIMWVRKIQLQERRFVGVKSVSNVDENSPKESGMKCKIKIL